MTDRPDQQQNDQQQNDQQQNDQQNDSPRDADELGEAVAELGENEEDRLETVAERNESLEERLPGDENLPHTKGAPGLG